MLRNFLTNESGATAVEYGIIATVLSLVIISGIGVVFDAIEQKFADNNSEIQQSINN